MPVTYYNLYTVHTLTYIPYIYTYTYIYIYRFPATYCGNARPLSLYTYPIVMPMLDLVKFNVYVSISHFKNGQLTKALCVFMNIPLFFTNFWITWVLAWSYVKNSVWICVCMCIGVNVGIDGEVSESESESQSTPDFDSNTNTNINITTNTKSVSTINNPLYNTTSNTTSNTNLVVDIVDVEDGVDGIRLSNRNV